MLTPNQSPHLLAPTASDLTRHGALNTILAGFHTDLNFLTTHGRSRYPGLHIWARNTGRRLAVRIPTLADRAPTLTAAASSSPSLSGDGDYLLVQAGKQLEHLTGGLVRAGYHEVVVNSATLAAMERRRREKPDRPLIRISSTFFWHLSSDFDLVPIPELAERARAIDGAAAAAAGGDRGKVPVYEAMKVGEQVQR